MSIYVGRWDCSRCGTQLIEGPKTRCPNCGAPRPEDVQFYLPDESDVVTDATAIRQAKAGVDWICGHCRAQNKAEDPQCKSCGNPRDELSRDVDLQRKDYEQGQVPRAAQPQRKATDDYPAPRRKKRNPQRMLLGLLLVIVALMALSFWPVSTQVEVVGFRWERQVQMEHYEPVERSAWNLPAGAYNVRKERAIHHYDKVFSHNETYYEDVRVKVGEERYVCGKEDMGNGYFRDRYCTRPIYETRREKRTRAVYNDVPVYRDKYFFSIMEWVPRSDQLLQASGQDQRAEWPSRSYPDADKWRVSERQGRYFVTVQMENGETHEEQLPENRWQSLSPGQQIEASKSLLWGSYQGLKEM